MADSNLAQIRKKLQDLTAFLEQYEPLASSHIGNFFTEDLWSSVVPERMQNEFHDPKSIEDFAALYPKIVTQDMPVEFSKSHFTLVEFFKSIHYHSVTSNTECLLPWNKLREDLISMGCQCRSQIEWQGFMKPKKLHEVQQMSEVAALTSSLTNTSHIVDVGGGKGYLSSILGLHYNHKVISVDSSQLTSCGAVKRTEIMAQKWSSLTKTINGVTEEKDLSYRNLKEKAKTNCKQVITYVAPTTDLAKLVHDHFNENCSGISLVGLHTCGDLAPTSLRMFVTNKNVRSLVNVGCCYHLITEDCILKPFWEGNDTGFGFPMSQFLKEKKFYLGRNARMLAAHSLDRHAVSTAEFPVKSMLFRCILQTVIVNSKKHNLLEGQVGRLYSKCNNFQDYMRKALKILDLDIKMSDEDLKELYDKYEGKELFLRVYFLLRISLAPIIESIILLDRLLFLLEQDIKQAYLVPLFDPVISPRRFAIVAWKDLLLP